MAHRSIVGRGGLAALVLCGALGGCSEADSRGGRAARSSPSNRADATLAPSRSQPAPSKPATARDDERPAIAPAELPPAAARGPLLGRLPKSTLFALRLPHVEKLEEAWRRTPLQKLMEMPELAEQRAKAMAGVDHALAELDKQFADFAALKEKFLALGGEVVVALLSIDGRALMARSGDFEECPFTAAVLFDAGDHAEHADVLLQRLFAVAEREKERGATLTLLSSAKDSWHRRLIVDGSCIDLLREGSQFWVHAGPQSGASDAPPLAPRAVEDSFAAADIVRATPDLAREGSLPFAEFFLNLQPIWSVAEVLAPPDVRDILTGSGATSISGISVSAALGRSGIDEEVLILAPTGKDLLTRLLTGRPMDSRLAAYVPPEAKTASLSTFDFVALFDGVSKLLPVQKRRELDQSIEGMKGDGFDLRGDLLGNVGPTFGYAADGDFTQFLAPRAALGGALDFTLLVELQDAPRFKRMIDRFLRSSGMLAHVRTGMVQGVPTASLEAIPLPGPDGQVIALVEPSWHVGDHAFVFSTSSAAFERSLGAARNAGNRGPDGMHDALEKHGPFAFSISTTAPFGELPGATSIGKRTGLGLELSCREGPGTTSTFVLAAGTGVLAAVAIPSMLNSRVAANENLAVATLRNISSAEAQFQATAALDQDGDGRGEYGTLAELTGSSPLAGSNSVLEPPVLSASLIPEASGCSTKAGYVFRIDVPRRGVGGVDLAEKRFVAYAWPVSQGATGGKVYVIDADGKLFFSDNRGATQNYFGTEHGPAADAADLRDDADRVTGVTAVRRGRDGGIWLEHE